MFILFLLQVYVTIPHQRSAALATIFLISIRNFTQSHQYHEQSTFPHSLLSQGSLLHFTRLNRFTYFTVICDKSQISLVSIISLVNLGSFKERLNMNQNSWYDPCNYLSGNQPNRFELDFKSFGMFLRKSKQTVCSCWPDLLQSCKILTFNWRPWVRQISKSAMVAKKKVNNWTVSFLHFESKKSRVFPIR